MRELRLSSRNMAKVTQLVGLNFASCVHLAWDWFQTCLVEGTMLLRFLWLVKLPGDTSVHSYGSPLSGFKSSHINFPMHLSVMDRPPNNAFTLDVTGHLGGHGIHGRRQNTQMTLASWNVKLTGHKTVSAETGLTPGPSGLGDSHDPCCSISPLCWLHFR